MEQVNYESRGETIDPKALMKVIKEVDKDKQRLPEDQKHLPTESNDYVNTNTTLETEDCEEPFLTNTLAKDTLESTGESGYYKMKNLGKLSPYIDSFKSSSIPTKKGYPAGYGYVTEYKNLEVNYNRKAPEPSKDYYVFSNKVYNNNANTWRYGSMEKAPDNQYKQANRYLLRGHELTVRSTDDLAKIPPHKGEAIYTVGRKVPQASDHTFYKKFKF